MNDRRIVILGFMGSGKTTVAEVLARKLACDFVDLDSFITKSQGRSPAEIIEQDGEPSFREIETLALRDVLQNRDVRVVALGGGTWTMPANRTLVALHDCLSIWLDAPFELCWERITSSRNTIRPMAPDHDTAKGRYESRRANYALADRRIQVTDSHASEKLADQILRES